MTVQIYDIATDAMRPVTQDDISNFGELNKSWGRIQDAMKKQNLSYTQFRQLVNFERTRLMKIWKSPGVKHEDIATRLLSSADSDSDNVTALFSDRPSAKPLGVQEDVVELLEQLLYEARLGTVVGIALVASEPQGGYRQLAKGKMTYAMTVGTLEKLKQEILFQWAEREFQEGRRG